VYLMPPTFSLIRPCVVSAALRRKVISACARAVSRSSCCCLDAYRALICCCSCLKTSSSVAMTRYLTCVSQFTTTRTTKVVSHRALACAELMTKGGNLVHSVPEFGLRVGLGRQWVTFQAGSRLSSSGE